MRIAITGHRGLSAEVTRYVDAQLRARLAEHRDSDGELVGVTCLADGADQLFAHAVLDAGGKLSVIVPAAAYHEGLPAEAHDDYDRLLACAAEVHKLDFTDSTETAHMAASEAMLDTADRLFAVWDGQPSRGYGGTADVVAAARRRNLPVTVIWPPGATRD